MGFISSQRNDRYYKEDFIFILGLYKEYKIKCNQKDELRI